MKPERSLSGSGRVTKEQAKNAIAQGWQRVVRDHGKETVAATVGCDKRTVENTMALKTLPEAHLLLNLLDLDTTALNEWLALKGVHAVPCESAMTPDMQTVNGMGHALTHYLDVMLDGRRCHRDTLGLAELLRPLIPRLTAIVHEADGLRRVG